MENKIKRFLSLAVAVIMVIGMLPGNVFASETTDVVEVATYDELVAALSNGGEIKLTADITVDTAITALDGTVIDLNSKTLYVNVENSYYNNVTIKNGNIVLGKDDVHVCDGYFLVNAGKTLVLNGVKMTSSDEGIKGYAVFHLKTGANLDLISSELNISDNEYTAGYVVYASESTATVDITGTTLVGKNVNGIVHATTVIDGSNITIEAAEHGINRSGVTINNSTVTISGGTGRGITAQHGDLIITGNSVVTISEMGEATIELRNDKNLTVADTATVTVDAAVNNTTNGTISGTVTVKTVPAGTLGLGYVSGNYYGGQSAIWGEATANPTESFAVEIYAGETLIATTTLVDSDKVLLTGTAQTITWHAAFYDDGDSWWNTVWAEGYPNINMAPDKVVLYVDGTKVAENSVVMSSPDDLNKIVALAEGFTGGVQAYTTLTDAIGNFNGRQVNVLCDVTESIESFNGCTLTTNVEGGVTITSTYDGWINANDFNIGKGVTVVGGGVFYETDGVNTIEGTLKVTDTFYHGYNAKTTVQNGGKIIVEGDNASTILRYNTDADAGLYIYGDNDPSTVEFSCSYYIGAYSGTFYAENANIECGYFLLQPSYDTAKEDETTQYPPMEVTLNNSTLTTVGTTDGQGQFTADDQASITLTNGSKIEIKTTYSEDETVAVSVDATSTIVDSTGQIYPVVITGLSGSGTEEDPYLITCLEELIWFRDQVDTQASDGSTQFAGKYFKLTADIDLAGINWNPIGSMTGDHGSFKGVFDGNGKTISNLTISSFAENGAGLFARTAGDAEIKNLTLHNVSISSTSNYVGAVVGNAYASTKITNVHVTGDVQISGRGYIGGIAGHGYVVMDTVSVKANAGSTINSTFWCAGGILGYGGEGATNITNASVENLTIQSAAGGLGSIIGMAEDNEGTQPISGSNLSAKNVVIKTYEGAYGTGYAEYALGYLYGGNPTSILTGTLVAENVTFECSNGNTEPAVNDAVAKIGNNAYFDLASAFAAAQDGDEVEILRAGTYALSTSGKDITITGAVDGVVFDNIGAKNMGGANVTFNNVTFDYLPNTNYTGLQHSGNLVYNNCIFNGTVFLYGTSETFNTCTFNVEGDAYNVWTYGAKVVNFNGCTFNSTGKSVLVYNEGACATDLTVTDCDFIATSSFDGKAAIEIDTSLMPEGTDIVIDGETTATGFAAGSVSGSTLWNDKKNQTNLTVTVDGELVWPLPTATIGHGLQTIVTPSKPREAVTFTVEDVYAKSELKVELYSNGTLIATTTLRQADRDDATALLYPAEGDRTVNIVVSGAEAGSWDTTWHVAPSVAYIPDTIKVYVDGSTEPADTYTAEGGVFLDENEKAEYLALDGVYKSIIATDESGNVTYYTSLDALFAADFSGEVTVELLENVSTSNVVDTAYDTTYNFVTNVEGGVTMDWNYADNWNYVQFMSLGEGITLNVPGYLLAWSELEISGTVNTGYAYFYGADVTVNEGAVLNVTTGEKTTQVKSGATLTVYGTVNASTLNVWNNDAKLVVSGENAKLTASWIDIWSGTPSVVIEDGATLEVDAIKASRGGSITIDGATLDTDSLELGHNGESSGTLTVTNNGGVTGETKLTAVDSTVTGPEGMNVTTTVADHKVVYENGVYSVVAKTYVATVTTADGTVTKYETIAEAIAAAQAGDTVTIFAGEYTGDVSVNKAITVVGETDAEGNNLVTINGKLNLTADNAVAKNLTVKSSGNGLYINAADVLIEGCDISGSNGVRYCYTSGTVTFKNSKITGNTYGIHFDGNSNGNIVIEGCEITGWTSFASTIDHVTITDTEFKDGNYNLLRFYQNATLTNVTFPSGDHTDYAGSGMRIDVGNGGGGMDGVTVTMTNCKTADGTALVGAIDPETAAKTDYVVDGVLLVVEASVTDAAGEVTYYWTLAEALAAAKDGDTVTLLNEATESYVLVTPGVTLDLNGKTLNATYATTFGNSFIVDNSDDNTGLLKIAKDAVVLNKSNTQLPVWTGEGYIFDDVQIVDNRSGMGITWNATDDVATLKFVPFFGDKLADPINSYLMNGASDNEVSIIVRLTWTTDNGTAYQNFVYNDTQVGTVVAADGNKAFILNLNGYLALEDLTISAMILSETGVEISGTVYEAN